MTYIGREEVTMTYIDFNMLVVHCDTGIESDRRMMSKQLSAYSCTCGAVSVCVGHLLCY